jgi:hypothetical protein
MSNAIGCVRTFAARTASIECANSARNCSIPALKIVHAVVPHMPIYYDLTTYVVLLIQLARLGLKIHTESKNSKTQFIGTTTFFYTTSMGRLNSRELSVDFEAVVNLVGFTEWSIAIKVHPQVRSVGDLNVREPCFLHERDHFVIVKGH